MQLLIDFGNTRLKWAVLRAGEFRFGGDAAYKQQALPELLRACWADLETPAAILCASVAADDYRQALQDWCQSQWQCPIQFVVPTAHSGRVRNAYAQPGRLGADRWAALIAAHRLTSHHVGIIDCGSALTVDVLRADGTHVGGYIIPGLTMMGTCLLTKTGNIQAQDMPMDSLAPGTSTESCIGHGVLQASVAFINQLMNALQQEYDQQIEFILTGGDASQVQPWLMHACRMEPDLVLRGLAYLAAGAE